MTLLEKLLTDPCTRKTDDDSTALTLPSLEDPCQIGMIKNLHRKIATIMTIGQNHPTRQEHYNVRMYYHRSHRLYG